MPEAKKPSMFTPERVRSIGALYRSSPEGTMGHTLVAAVDELEATRAALAKLQEAANRLCDGADSFTNDEDGNEAGFLDAKGIEGLRAVTADFYTNHYAPVVRKDT